jgi:hypothetical protein
MDSIAGSVSPTIKEDQGSLASTSGVAALSRFCPQEAIFGLSRWRQHQAKVKEVLMLSWWYAQAPSVVFCSCIAHLLC